MVNAAKVSQARRFVVLYVPCLDYLVFVEGDKLCAGVSYVNSQRHFAKIQLQGAKLLKKNEIIALKVKKRN